MRPTNIQGYLAVSAKFMTEEGMARGLAYQPDPTDIFISPYAKCGTSWMQQIVHGLRTGGDMGFDEITQVTPWIEMAHDIGLAVPGDQPHPRAFKSHLSYHRIPKGGRYIVVLRDPVDAMRSLFRFMEGWFFETGSIPIADFAENYLHRKERGDYWAHAASWWEVRDRDDVLLFAYEHMKTDLPGTVAQVAEFIGIHDPDAIDIATRQAGFDFMKAHQDKFDDNITHAARDPVMGLPPGEATTKVNTGKVAGEAHLITPGMRARFDARWSETMNAEFGLASYADLLTALKKT